MNEQARMIIERQVENRRFAEMVYRLARIKHESPLVRQRIELAQEREWLICEIVAYGANRNAVEACTKHYSLESIKIFYAMYGELPEVQSD